MPMIQEKIKIVKQQIPDSLLETEPVPVIKDSAYSKEDYMDYSGQLLIYGVGLKEQISQIKEYQKSNLKQ